MERITQISSVERIFSVIKDAKDGKATPESLLALLEEYAFLRTLEPVDRDKLPPIGSEVEIHLGRQDAWVKHVVVGYFAWGSHSTKDHRVFVRVMDGDGYLNARMIDEIRSVSLSCPCLSEGSDL